MIYGPFFRNGTRTSESNLIFNKSLKLQNNLWGVRHLEKTNEIAFVNGFKLKKIIEMPANNISVIYILN